MKYEKLLALLGRGGVRPEDFNLPEYKSLHDLYIETNELDVLPILVNGTFARFAHSAKSIVRSGPEPHLCTHTLREVRRILPSGTSIEKVKPWGLSETPKRNRNRKRKVEKPMRALIRGIGEEFGIYDVDTSQIRRLTSWEVNGIKTEFKMTSSARLSRITSSDDDYDEHQSSVYPPGVWSVVISFWYEYSMPSTHFTANPNGFVALEPGGTKVVSQWFPTI
ncbi:MAG: hypothetical protein ABA06_03755 [Parcubacteria bacterium C7867-001]|nr:MAG: hypothetical protein ABA06_03755 [Parcubacteria bacterium C7867-001]